MLHDVVATVRSDSWTDGFDLGVLISCHREWQSLDRQGYVSALSERVQRYVRGESEWSVACAAMRSREPSTFRRVVLEALRTSPTDRAIEILRQVLRWRIESDDEVDHLNVLLSDETWGRSRSQASRQELTSPTTRVQSARACVVRLLQAHAREQLVSLVNREIVIGSRVRDIETVRLLIQDEDQARVLNDRARSAAVALVASAKPNELELITVAESLVPVRGERERLPLLRGLRRLGTSVPASSSAAERIRTLESQLAR